MALADLTKQLAEQAILNAATKPSGPPPPDNAGATIRKQLQAMQKALKDDEELVVLFDAGGQTLRVAEIFFPTWQVAVLTGMDRGEVTRAIAPVESLQLVCKVIKQPTPARVRFVAPKS